MIASMTGFGRGVASDGGKKLTVEIKSLNSKQFDLTMRLPNLFRELEGQTRNRLADCLERGKADCIATVELTGEETAPKLNVEVLREYKRQIEKLDTELGIAAPTDWHAILLRLPDTMKSESNELTEGEKETFWKAMEEAADQLTAFRIDEGKKLYDFFVGKIDNIRQLLAEVEPYETERVAKIKSRMLENLEKIAGVEYDRGRLEQELIYYIEKLDINEEKQRLRSHLDYFIETLGPRDETTICSKGKKLGFIAQEMGREINTLGSKSNNAEMQIIVVKMKDELEQIKEQVLNVL